MEWSEFKVAEEKLKFIYADLFELNEDLIGLLPKLKNNYKLVLLSNTNFIHQKYGWEKYSFLNNFDKLILSHEVGATKPETKIYRAVEAFTNEKPESHVFIDDVQDYVDGAKNCGWHGFQFTSYSKLISDLQTINIKVT
jgi:putative hydrolase of the HAD superfamily